MNRSASLLAMLCLFSFCQGLSAGERAGKSIDRQLQCTRCATTPCCCDVYCRKPFPCLPCPAWCGVGNDYCRKPLPCLPCLAPTGCANDYCRKPLPDLCCPPPVPCGRAPAINGKTRSP